MALLVENKFFFSFKSIQSFLLITFFYFFYCNNYFSQTYTFTTCGATGRFGPTQTQANTAYSVSNLNGSVTVNNGVQNFTIPVSGLYRIDVRGAKGGNGYAPVGGSGAKMRGDFYLNQGQVLKILVGQAGTTGTVPYTQGGGGGGSFVTFTNNVPLIVASGGGGGAYLNMYSYSAINATGSIGTSASNGINGNYSVTAGIGGLSGYGGYTVVSNSYTSGVGSGGGGLLSSGQGGSFGIGGGVAFINGGTGGIGATSSVGIGGDGGFGGGGGGDWSNATGGGGGGGYSGGGGGVHYGWGGGGSSYNSGANQLNSAGSNGTVGLVVITKLLSGVAISQTSLNGCNGYSTAVLSATPIGGTAPYYYTWLPGGTTTSSVGGLSAGNYTCIVTDALSTTFSSSFIINSPNSLIATISSQSNVSCFGGSNGKANVNITGGTYPFTYSWAPTGGSTALGTNLSAGNYTCFISDLNGCTTTVTTSILQATTVLNAMANVYPSTIICQGQPLILYGTGATTYSWQVGNNQAPITNGSYFYPQMSNNYTMTAFDSQGCSGTATLYVPINLGPPVSISTLSSICAGSTNTLIANGANTYTWNGSIVSPSISINPSVNTVYTVTGTGSNGCTLSAVRSVSVDYTPTVFINSSSYSVCVGNTVSVNGIGASSYSWTGGISNNVPFTPTISSQYTVTGFNACGTSTNSIGIIVVPLPSLSIVASNTSVCLGNTLTLTGNGANSYTWSSNISNGVSFTPTSTATYTFSGSNNCGAASTSITIYVNPLPNITINTNSFVCIGGTTALQALGASSYTWSGGITNNVPFSPTVNSVYTVIATSTNGCQNTSIQTISVGMIPSLSVTISNPVVCFGGTTSINALGANSYSWSGGILNNTPFSPTITSNYTLTGSNTCGTSSLSTSITVNTLPNVNITSTNSVVCLGGTIALQGTGALNYQWSGNIINNIAFSPSITTTYYLIGTDVNGCQNFASKTISVNPLPNVTTNVSNSLICIGSTVSINGFGANTYSLSGGLFYGSAFTPSSTTIYTITGTDNNGCVNSAVQTISVVSNQSISANTSTPTICLGNTVSLYGAGANTYTWTGGISNNVPFSPSVTTTYSLYANNFCGTGSANITVTVLPLPSLFVLASSNSVCFGNSVTLNAGGALSYTWSGGIVNNIPFTPSATNTYSVIGTDLNGCKNYTNQIINVNTLPTLGILASNTAICIGNSLTLTANGANTYTWSNGILNGVGFSPSLTNYYLVVGTNTTTGCVSNTMAITITVHPLPIIGSTNSNITVCSGNFITLNGTGANTYTWSGNILNGIAFQPNSNSTFTVNGTNTITGCTSTNNAVVSVSLISLPILTASSINSVICLGGTTALNASGAHTYSWSGSINNGIVFSPTITNTYSVYGTNTITGCTSTNNAIITITVNNLPSVSITVINQSVCQGNTVSLTGINADVYSWTNGLQNGVPFTPLNSNTFTVIGTNTITGCSNSATQSIIVNPLPNIIAQASQSIICQGYSISLSAYGANSYTWSSGIFNATPFIPLASNIYSVSGSNSLTGCMGKATISITVNSLPTLSVITTNTEICLGTNVTLLASGAHNYLWSNGVLNGIAFTPTSTSIYTCIGNNTLSGCSNSITQLISVNPLPVLTISGSTLLCLGESNTLIASGASSYTWNHNQISNQIIITPSVSTMYSVTGINNTNCADSINFTIMVDYCTKQTEIENLNQEFNVYPNPSQGVFTITTNISGLNFSIYDEMGKLLLTLDNDALKSIDLREFKQGIYFLKAWGDGKTHIIKKLIVSN